MEKSLKHIHKYLGLQNPMGRTLNLTLYATSQMVQQLKACKNSRSHFKITAQGLPQKYLQPAVLTAHRSRECLLKENK